MFSPETYAMAKKYTDDHGGESPHWSAVQDKPFSTIGEGLTVDDDGVLNADGGGTSDHSQLTNRDADNQHPISAINGLQSALDAKGTYSKPSTGIPDSDIASAATWNGKQNAINANNKLPVAYVSGYTTKAMVVTYDDDTTETFNVMVVSA